MKDYEANSLERTIYQVVDLNRGVRHVLETNFSKVWVEGEASNVKTPVSGHVYFTLKDEAAQIRCVCFRSTVSRLDSAIEDGVQLLVYAKVTVYEARGDCQLQILDVQLAGAGALQRAFLALKDKLQKRGWFDPENKLPIPTFPQRVGVITSSTGAALRDVLRVLQRRFPAIHVIIYPSLVQGADAAKQLVSAVEIANDRNECDVLLLVRGGGSIEDLWSFNDENLAAAIYNSELPIISGVGHQIDFTIADFVADQRAATPSAAAEMVSPDRVELLAELMSHGSRMQHAMRISLQSAQLQLEKLNKRLVHPGDRINSYQVRAQQLYERLEAVMRIRLESARRRLLMIYTRISALDLNNMLTIKSNLLQQSAWQCQRYMDAKLRKVQHEFSHSVKALELLNPLEVLSRGYALVEKDGVVVSNASEVKTGDSLQIKFAKDLLKVVVQ